MPDGSAIENAEKGTVSTETQHLTCCSCTHQFMVGAARRLAVCPSCGQRMGTSELQIDEDFSGTRLCTAGSVTVGPRAAVAVEQVSASGAIDISGAIDADIRSLDLVRIRSTASVRGKVTARRLIIDPGASVDDARFEIYTPQLDIADVLARRAAGSATVTN